MPTKKLKRRKEKYNKWNTINKKGFIHVIFTGKHINTREITIGEQGQAVFEHTALTQIGALPSPARVISFTDINVVNTGKLSVCLGTNEQCSLEGISSVQVIVFIYLNIIF